MNDEPLKVSHHIDAERELLNYCKEAFDNEMEKIMYRMLWESCVEEFERKKILANILKDCKDG